MTGVGSVVQNDEMPFDRLSQVLQVSHCVHGPVSRCAGRHTLRLGEYVSPGSLACFSPHTWRRWGKSAFFSARWPRLDATASLSPANR